MNVQNLHVARATGGRYRQLILPLIPPLGPGEVIQSTAQFAQEVDIGLGVRWCLWVLVVDLEPVSAGSSL